MPLRTDTVMICAGMRNTAKVWRSHKWPIFKTVRMSYATAPLSGDVVVRALWSTR